jgi:membrane protein DedA with SNARE-associated domain
VTGTRNEDFVMPIERETIITDGGATRSAGSGLLIGVIAVVLIVLLVGGITVFNGGFSFGGKSVTVDVPKVTVTK